MSKNTEMHRLEKLAETDTDAAQRLYEKKSREGDEEACILLYLLKCGRTAIEQFREDGYEFDISKLFSLGEDLHLNGFLQHLRLKSKSIFVRLMEEANFLRVSESITEENFPIQKEPVLDGLEVLHFNECLKTGQIFDRIYHKGCRPANFAELLLWAIKKNPEQIGYPTVSLGSDYVVFTDDYYSYSRRYVPFLQGDSSLGNITSNDKLVLSLHNCCYYFDDCFRFLVRRK